MGLFSKIFGGSKQKSQSTSQSSSSNLSYPWQQQTFAAPAAQSVNSSTGMLNNILGGGFQGYKDQIGYDFLQDEGRDKVLGNLSGKGVLGSGAALKRLTKFSHDLESTTLTDYLDKLLQQSGIGINLAQLIGGTGGVSTGSSQSTSKGSSTPGIAGFIGSILGSVAGAK